MFAKFARLVAAALLVSALIGCGKDELGPMDAADVKPVDPQELKQGMEESAKHLPPGVNMPPGVLPENNSN